MLKLSGPVSSIPALCLSEPSPTAISRIHYQLPKTIEDWECWLHCVQKNRVEAQTFSAITKLKLITPRWVSSSLEERSQIIRLQNRLRRENLIILLKKLQEHQIPILLLQSCAIANEIYRDYDYNHSDQVNLIIKPEDKEKVFTIYQNLGYTTLSHNSLTFNNSDTHTINWPMFFNQDFTLQLMTSWTLPHINYSTKIDPSDLWQRATKFTYEGVEVQRLSKEDFIHHLCISTNILSLSVRELSDIYNCLIKWKDFNWSLFAQIVNKTDSFDLVYTILSISQSFYFIPSAQDYLNSITKLVSKKTLSFVENRLETPEKILLYQTSYFNKIIEIFQNFNETKTFTNKIKIFIMFSKHILWPNLEDVSNFNFQDQPSTLLSILNCRLRAFLKTISYLIKML